jgi:hypothetical protein
VEIDDQMDAGEHADHGYGHLAYMVILGLAGCALLVAAGRASEQRDALAIAGGVCLLLFCVAWNGFTDPARVAARERQRSQRLAAKEARVRGEARPAIAGMYLASAAFGSWLAVRIADGEFAGLAGLVGAGLGFGAASIALSLSGRGAGPPTR